MGTFLKRTLYHSNLTQKYLWIGYAVPLWDIPDFFLVYLASLSRAAFPFKSRR